MPAVLTHKTIMLLARKRLEEIEEALRVKRLAGVVPRSTIEERVEALVTKALEYMNSDPAPSTDFPGAPYAKPLGSGVSKFAVMGAMGPDIPAFASALAPGQAWTFDNIHKGYPDEDREAVVAQTCDFILLDSPSTAECTDAHTVAVRAGAALIVARKNMTSVGQVRGVFDAVSQVGATVVGTVLNDF